LTKYKNQQGEKVGCSHAIVVDHSKIHTSNALEERLEEWTEQGFTIFELPSYSPELNLIEIL
jgi:transposase